jgi:hypothetical protein
MAKSVSVKAEDNTSSTHCPIVGENACSYEVAESSDTAPVVGGLQEEEIDELRRAIESLEKAAASELDERHSFENYETFSEEIVFEQQEPKVDDLSQYYFSDEEDSSEDEFYTEFDEMECASEMTLQQMLCESSSGAVEERQMISKVLRDQRRQNRAVKKQRFHLPYVKATWLSGIASLPKGLPAFNLVVTSHEDSNEFTQLCFAH